MHYEINLTTSGTMVSLGMASARPILSLAIFVSMMVCTRAYLTVPGILHSSSRSPRPVLPAGHCLRASKSYLHPIMTERSAATETAGSWSTNGMGVEEFFTRSIGSWRSLRSSHNIAFGQIEEVNSNIEISTISGEDPELIQICDIYKADPKLSCSSVRMSWEGTSDWDEKEVLKGSSVLVVLKDGPNHGRLLRSVGYTDAVPAAGTWEMQPDGVFVLTTNYEKSAAEERIWFGTPDMRMRVSIIKTQGGKGVLTAALSTEVRKKA